MPFAVTMLFYELTKKKTRTAQRNKLLQKRINLVNTECSFFGITNTC